MIALWNNRPLRRLLVVAVHATLWAAAFALAVDVGSEETLLRATRGAVQAAAVLLLLRTAGFLVAGLFDGIWRYAGFLDLEKLVLATTASSVIALLLDLTILTGQIPLSVYLTEWLASIVFAGGARLAMRSVIERRQRRAGGLRTLIIGAGDAGESLVRDVQRKSAGVSWLPVGFLDDDAMKHGALIRGIRVHGAADDASIERYVQALAIHLVVLAMPTAPGSRIRAALRVCNRLAVEVRTVPALADRLPHAYRARNIREINIADLLRREPVQLDVAQIEQLVRERVVLVTGAGGSIGSELCRQLLPFVPRQLLLLDHDENALFHIDRELCSRAPRPGIVPLIADITDEARVRGIFERYRPSLVLHAAAHKHVEMMEKNPCEAVKNNVLGTIALAEAAQQSAVDAFVLVSTDKAVRPSSVMGASKRVTEMIVQRFARPSSTRFVAVRFGNVLGSAGSVVPIFCEQIARGGPITVTHPDVVRYFMTIPEASQLVLEAATLARSGEILMLDMGDPVRILDLARDLIELSGMRDIETVFTGLKPGEKLSEDLLLEEETYDRTPHPKIVVGRIQPIEPAVLDRALDQLLDRAERGDDGGVRLCLAAMIADATLTLPSQDDRTVEPLRGVLRTSRAG